MAFRDLPTFYYHTHFSEFLDFVKGPSAHLLSPEDNGFLNNYQQTSHLQQCLVVRLINKCTNTRCYSPTYTINQARTSGLI
jgi:DNA polymerase-3 subunit epsilon